MKKCENGHLYNDTVVRVCPVCGKPPISQEEICGNCLKPTGEGEFCKHCGNPKGAGAFEPQRNIIPCVYGSPVIRTLKCLKCGAEITTGGMRIPGPIYCKKCRSIIPSEPSEKENDSQEFLKVPDLNELSEVAEPVNVTQAKTPLTASITFHSMFVDGFTSNGKRAGGSETLIYYNDKRIVEKIHNSYGESKESCKSVTETLAVPAHIKYKEDLTDYILSQQPKWYFYLEKHVSPQKIAEIMETLYGNKTVENVKQVKKSKKRLIGLLLALGVSVCAIVLILLWIYR